MRGSLQATEDGFAFQLRNRLGSGYAKRLLPLTLDGTELDMASTGFEIEGTKQSFADVTKDAPFTLAMNKTTTISYSGGPLSQGPHKIGMRFEVAGLGELGFEFSDVTA